MNTVKLSDAHLGVINTALEVYSRLRSGQIRMALNTAYIDKQHVADSFAKETEIENLIKKAYFPELVRTGSYYSFSSPEMGNARIGYEILKTFEEFLSVKKNGGYYGTGTNFYGPLKASNEPWPEVVGFNKYKDFPLTKKQSIEVRKLAEDKKFSEMWDYIRAIKSIKAKGFKMETIDLLDVTKSKVKIRVWRPERIKEEPKSV